MIWPFKKKNKRIKSKSSSATEYNELRASVGMKPAGADDFCEAVAWVFVYELLAQEVKDECNQCPVEDQALFMMAYASYLKWLAMKGVESSYPSGSWGKITSLIERELYKQPWYKSEVMDQLFNTLIEHPPIGNRRGKHSKVSLGPWSDVELACMITGFNFTPSTSMEFTLYVPVTSTKILKTINKIAPK